MRAAVLGAALLWQFAVSTGPVADPRFLRYEREVRVDGSGEACATLDAAVFAHVESRAGDDLRVFEAQGHEVPFALTENEPQPEAQAVAAVEGLRGKGDRVEFDLRMPSRVYSEVNLRLNAKDFVAVAEVTDAETGTKLGTFTVFDLSGKGLARSTTLRMAEAKAPKLHVVMRFYAPDGTRFLGVPAVDGADVPVSREAQAMYTVVAQTDEVVREGAESVARLALPAHVPVERLSVVVDAGENFAHGVKVVEEANGGGREVVLGEISRTVMTLPGVPTAPVIHEERTAVDAVLAANLRRAAMVEVRIAGGALPVRAVKLEMRQRKVCFAAAQGTSYVLRYGDAALRAPVYEYARSFDGARPVVNAVLGPERMNARWVARVDARSYAARHPEGLWVLLIGVVAVLGATLVSSVKHRGQG